MILGANKGFVSSLWLTLFWWCLLATANVVYGYVVTHQFALMSNLGSSLVTGAAVYIFIIAVSAGLYAFASRLTGGGAGQSPLSGGAMLGAAVAYVAFVAVVIGMTGESLDDAFRIIIPILLFFAIPTVVVAMNMIRRSVKRHAIDPSRHIGTGAIFVFCAVIFYVSKTQLDLSGTPDLLGRFAVIFFGIVVPSYFFISAFVSILARRIEPTDHRTRTLLLAGLGAFLIPLVPIIA